jgi:hypothetical protein
MPRFVGVRRGGSVEYARFFRIVDSGGGTGDVSRTEDDTLVADADMDAADDDMDAADDDMDADNDDVHDDDLDVDSIDADDGVKVSTRVDRDNGTATLPGSTGWVTYHIHMRMNT